MLVIVTASHAKQEKQKKSFALEYQKIDENTILITEGFKYRKDMSLRKMRTNIDNARDGILYSGDFAFIPLCAQAEESVEKKERENKEGFSFQTLSDAVGITWIFNRPGIKFSCWNKNYKISFKSIVRDATIEFTENGVLVKNFYIESNGPFKVISPKQIVLKENQEREEKKEEDRAHSLSDDYNAAEMYNKGVEYAIEGKFTEARNAFEEAQRIDPKLTICESNIRVIDEVIKRRMKKEVAIYIFRAVTYSDKQKWGESIAEYSKAIALDANCAIAYFNRGLVFYNKQQHDRAISDFSKAISKYPKDTLLYKYRGMAYEDKGQYDRAIADFNKAISIDPKDEAAYNNRAVSYRHKGQYDRAIENCNKAIDINPNYALAYDNRGYTYMKLNKTSMACSDWKKACELGNCTNYDVGKAKGYCK